MIISVLMGGSSAEREVSIKTGEAVIKACEELGHKTLSIDFYDDYKSSSKLIFDEVIEEELFGKHKYEPKQTSVMITYQP